MTEVTREEIEKEIAFAEMVLGAVNNKHIRIPMIVYEEEKKVVRKALNEYVSKLENELRGR